MLRWALALIATVALSACFSSEQPLFLASESAQPIADDARFLSHEPDGSQRYDVTFHRADDAYTVRGTGRSDDGSSPSVIFIPIPSTPEEDYILQQSGDDAVIYAFLWRRGGGYRVFLTDARMNEGEQPLFCERWSYGVCSFASRDDMLAYYEFLLYPAFVHGDQTPALYLDLMPPDEGASPRQRAH